jgi:hypothetical protein
MARGAILEGKVGLVEASTLVAGNARKVAVRPVETEIGGVVVELQISAERGPGLSGMAGRARKAFRKFSVRMLTCTLRAYGAGRDGPGGKDEKDRHQGPHTVSP